VFFLLGKKDGINPYPTRKSAGRIGLGQPAGHMGRPFFFFFQMKNFLAFLLFFFSPVFICYEFNYYQSFILILMIWNLTIIKVHIVPTKKEKKKKKILIGLVFERA
jgi:hypothetical protein